MVKLLFKFHLGITEDNLQKLLHHAMIPEDKKQIILNLQNIGMQILQDPAKVCLILNFLIFLKLF